MQLLQSFAFCLSAVLASALPAISAQRARLPELPPASAFEAIQFGDGKASPGADAGEGVGASYFGDAPHSSQVSPPAQLLGRALGSWLASPAEIVAAFRQWDGEGGRLRMQEYGRTHEGRELIYALISSTRNMDRLEEIQAGIARLADPRGLSEAEAAKLIETLPAVAWLGYSIHGDETSGADASLAVAYHLAACQDPALEQLLENVVVVMDPCMNPDGRARFLAQLTAGHGHVQNRNHSSMHRGRWPYGRTNHYLFDMNRDWMTGIAPETRGRWRVLSVWRPQLFVDGHEMSGLDTYLFYPQTDPKHYALPSGLFDWQERFAADCARSFDGFGWGYYTREWADAWYPAYSDAWGSLNGAIGMLYEQGRVGGQPLRRASGEVVTYREAVHGQVVASMSNLQTLAANRSEILRDYLGGRRRNVDAARENARRAFVLTPGRHADREARWLSALLAQGIEVWRTDEPLAVSAHVDAFGARTDELVLAAGSWIVPSLQPQSPLVHAFLDFDPRIDESTLIEERASIERGEGSKFYDISAWDLGHAFDLQAAWCELPGAQPTMTRLTSAPPVAGGVIAEDAQREPYAYVVDGDLDLSLRFAGAALEAGLAVHLSDEAFQAGGRDYPAGSLLLRRHENQPDWRARVRAAAELSGAPVQAVYSGRSPGDGPDLGGGHFVLLERPRIALLANSPISDTDYGHVWQLVDEQLGLPATVLDAQDFGSYDLRRYNVLVVPPAGDLASVLADQLDSISDWVRAGGTLIAMGSSAADFASGPLELGSVKRRRDVLEELGAYSRAVARERGARQPEIDMAALWEDPAAGKRDEAGAQPKEPMPAEAKEAKEAPAPDEVDEADEADSAAERDAWMRRFSPAGLILRAEVDRRAWITAGCGEELPVFFSGSSVLMAKDPVATPVRIAAAERMRLGGLLWPEARERIADSAWLTVESLGSGQVILFASPPAYRGIFQGGSRLLANAIVLGPGAGANAPLGW